MSVKSSTSDLISNYIKEGKIVPNEITSELLKNEMYLNRNKVFFLFIQYEFFLIDGYPRNFDNFNGWQQKMKDLIDIKTTILLECDKVILNLIVGNTFIQNTKKKQMLRQK